MLPNNLSGSLTRQKDLIPILLKPLLPLRPLINPMHIQPPPRRRIRHTKENRLANPLREPRSQCREQIRPPIMRHRNHLVDLLVVENRDDIRGHGMPGVEAGYKRFGGLPVAETVGSDDPVAMGA